MTEPVEDVDEFLARCDDVLTYWWTSPDAMHCEQGVPVEAPWSSRSYVPLTPEIDFDREAFVEGLRAAWVSLAEVLRPMLGGSRR